MKDYAPWVGRSEVSWDVAAAGPFERLADLLDHPGSGTPPQKAPFLGHAPLLGHWLTFLPRATQSTLGTDGHPRRGGFLPPVSLPRRMWAGSRLRFLSPIPVGSAVTRRSIIQSIEPKVGRSGAMVFVTVSHEIFAEDILSIAEDQDIVYREAPKPQEEVASRTPKASPSAEWSRTVSPDPVLLFRYSALTYNAHRIHYDQPFCRDVEGYPGLVVHGPLIATLLLDHFQQKQPDAKIVSFRFRAQQPLFSGASFTLNGVASDQKATLWASKDGQTAMSAEVEFK